MAMTEKEQFLQNWEREFETTLRVLRNYPANKPEFKPHERSRSAAELAWTLAGEEQVFVNGVLEGKIDFSKMTPPPSRFEDILSAYEKSHRSLASKLQAAPEAELNGPIAFSMGPGKMGEMRKMDVLWGLLMDSIHHRGQFSVYLRMAGGKVPSIYGPSADEPWM